MKPEMLVATSVALLMTIGMNVFGQDQHSAAQIQSLDAEAVYGWQLMSEEERKSYQKEFGALTTTEEKQKFRQHHQETIRARAAEQGVSLSGPRRSGASGKGRGERRRNSAGGNRPAFADFDSNKDGFIAPDEYAKGHAARVVKQAKEGRAMKNVGTNSFADIDVDGDGRASPEEFAAHQAKQHQKNRH